MRKFFVLAFLFFLALPAFSSAETLRVKHVYDGDTVVLENDQRVRLIGVDAPEIENRRYGRKAEYYGEEARVYLESLVEGKTVRVENGDEAFDQYGRRLAYLFLPDGVFVNRKLIEEGYAGVFRKFPFQYRDEFLQVEEQARAKQLGVWKPVVKRTLWQRLFGVNWQ